MERMWQRLAISRTAFIIIASIAAGSNTEGSWDNEREKHIRESHNSTSKLKKTKRGGRGYEVIRRGQFETYQRGPILLEPPAQESTDQESTDQEQTEQTERAAQAQQADLSDSSEIQSGSDRGEQ